MRHAAARQHRECATDALTIYLNNIAASPLLTREEEMALAVRVADGDTRLPGDRV